MRAKSAILIVVSNPLDAMCHVAKSVCEIGFGISPKPPSALDAAPLIFSVLVIGCLVYALVKPDRF